MTAAGGRFSSVGGALLQRLVPLLLVSNTLACHSRPTPEDAVRERDGAASSATVGILIADAWKSGAVPGIYAGPTLMKLGSRLDEVAASSAWRSLPPPGNDLLRAGAAGMARTLAMLDSAVGRGDRSTGDLLRRRLAAERDQLAAVAIDTSGP